MHLSSLPSLLVSLLLLLWPSPSSSQLMDWATTHITEECHFNVVIRYSCSEDPFYPFSDPADLARACDELIPRALTKYFEQPIVNMGVHHTVGVTAEKADELMLEFLVQEGQDDDFCVSNADLLVRPVMAPWCGNDNWFMRHVAHTIGHSVLAASRDTEYSATHKGTTYTDHEVGPGAPLANCDGSHKLDLMHYFSDYHDNCLDENGNLSDNFYDLLMATESDTQVLVFYHHDREYEGHAQCGHMPGEHCSWQGECLNGLVCPDWECIECYDDDNCQVDQFCLGSGPELAHGHQRCLDRYPPGGRCNRDRECMEGSLCDLEQRVCLTFEE